MMKYFKTIVFSFLIGFSFYSQNTTQGWTNTINSNKGFIENKGQFDARAKKLYINTAVEVFNGYNEGLKYSLYVYPNGDESKEN